MALAVLLSGAILAPVSQAQQAGTDTALERIVITGSNIRRSDTEQAENVQVITAQDIKRSGQPTVADFLRNASSSYAAFNETFLLLAGICIPAMIAGWFMEASARNKARS